ARGERRSGPQVVQGERRGERQAARGERRGERQAARGERRAEGTRVARGGQPVLVRRDNRKDARERREDRRSNPGR
ncbi:MAG: hypothetical protein AAFR52_16320, partial [Pseudomonadota bacterium]